MITNTTLFKATGVDAYPCHGGHGQWSKPTETAPGEWMHFIEDIEPCKRGYHVCEGTQVFKWIGEELYEVEIKGEQIREKDKIVAQQARLVRKFKTWNKRTARLFACDCAEHVLHIFQEKYPDDTRPAEAIDVARLYANGKATEEELNKARAAAAAAAASYNTARAARAARAAAYAAAASAYYAATDAADAAYYAIVSYRNERTWQYKQLIKYLNGEIK